MANETRNKVGTWVGLAFKASIKVLNSWLRTSTSMPYSCVIADATAAASAWRICD